MKGQERILAMRQNKRKPAAVFVTDLPAYVESTDVHVEPEDLPESLDLRFLVGLTVHVSVRDDSRGHRIAQACQAASRRCITAYHSPQKRGAIEITDTENGQWKF